MDVETLSQPRAGACLHISSLPGNYGIGELGNNALRFVHTLASMDLSVWQVLPTGPTGFGDSPYQLQSTFAGNEMLVDIEALVLAGYLTEKEVAELTELPADHVDFGRLIPIKTRLLATAAERFLLQATNGERAAYEDFVAEHDAGWLHDYALYRVLKKRHDERPWYEWAPQFAAREPVALQSVEADEQAAVTAAKVIQFLFRQQWDTLHDYAARHGVALLGDMAFYIAFDSADAWAHPEVLELDSNGAPERVAGVPPDYFSEDGQLWGNPVYDWAQHAASGYAWWVERMRYALTLADWVRIDHFRGFEAYWSVPADAPTARDGRWVKGPGTDIFDALVERLGPLPVVAEDLGVITPAVDALRERYHLPGMKVLQFELLAEDFDLAAIDVNTVCYTGTHDNDTTVGWFTGGPDDKRDSAEMAHLQETVLRITGGSRATVHLDILRLALNSPARIAIAPMQDILGFGSEARLNVPGTAKNNWRWRLLVEALDSERCELVRTMVQDAGRAEVH